MTEQNNPQQQIIRLKAQGASGCVFEGLGCRHGNSKTKLVAPLSKLMEKRAYDEEMKQNTQINKIDSNYHYHLKTKGSCDPEMTLSEYEYITKECTDPSAIQGKLINDLRANTKLILMQDGGENWDDYSQNSDLSLEDIKVFLVNSYNVVRGVQHMLDNNYIHDDIKVSNLVYNSENKRSNLIDFGRSKYKSDIYNVRKTEYYNDEDAFYTDEAPDRFLQYKTNFTNYKLTKNGSKPTENNWFYKSDMAGYNDYLEHACNGDLKKIDAVKNSISLVTKAVLEMQYVEFVNDALDVLDVYGIGFSFLIVTKRFKEKISELERNKDTGRVTKLVDAIQALAGKAANVYPFDRPTPERFAQEYEACITESLDSLELLSRLVRKENKNDFITAQWVRDSFIVEANKEWLELDIVHLLEYIKKNYNDTIQKLQALYNTIHWQEYDKRAKNNNFHLNLRYPQTLSDYNNQTKISDSDPDIKPSTRLLFDCINLIGSHYGVCICSSDSQHFQTDRPSRSAEEEYNLLAPDPYLFIDVKNTKMMYVTWSRNGVRNYVCFSIRASKSTKTNTPNIRNGIYTELNFGLDDMSNIFVQLQYDDKHFVRTALITELVCQTIVEMYSTKNETLSSIVGIICNESAITGYDVTLFKQTFQNLILSMQQSIKSIIPNNENSEDPLPEIKNILETRYKLSVIRGEIASVSEAHQSMRKKMNASETNEMHRNHACVGEIKRLASELAGLQMSNTETIPPLVALFSDMVKGMKGTDVAFVYTDIKVTVDDLNRIIKLRLSQVENISLRNLLQDNFIEHIIDRIRTSLEKNLNKTTERVRVYTQIQIQNMKREDLDSLVNFLLQDTKNNVAYVIFEYVDNQKPNWRDEERFLLHGFKLKENDSRTMCELVVLVPNEYCLFKVLEPMTWNFVNALRRCLLDVSVYESCLFSKETNVLFSSFIYPQGKIYVSMYHALYQTELLVSISAAVNNANETAIDDTCIDNWKRSQFLYMFSKCQEQNKKEDQVDVNDLVLSVLSDAIKNTKKKDSRVKK